MGEETPYYILLGEREDLKNKNQIFKIYSKEEKKIKELTLEELKRVKKKDIIKSDFSFPTLFLSELIN